MSSSANSAGLGHRSCGNRAAPNNAANSTSRPMQSRQIRRPENVWNDWSEYKSKTGRSYYYNKKTQKNIWEKPEGWDPGGHGNGHHSSNGQVRSRPQSNAKLIDEIQKLRPHLIGLREAAAKSGHNHHSNNHHNHHHHHKHDDHHHHPNPIRPPPKKRPMPSSGNASHNQPPNHVVNLHHSQQELPMEPNGYELAPMAPKRPTRAEEFKRVIDEIPKLPEYADFEALRPLTDNNLISDDVRKLTNGK